MRVLVSDSDEGASVGRVRFVPCGGVHVLIALPLTSNL
jgi:hypothetical protein